MSYSAPPRASCSLKTSAVVPRGPRTAALAQRVEASPRPLMAFFSRRAAPRGRGRARLVQIEVHLPSIAVLEVTNFEIDE
jgi:hypothetical protein